MSNELYKLMLKIMLTQQQTIQALLEYIQAKQKQELESYYNRKRAGQEAAYEVARAEEEEDMPL